MHFNIYPTLRKNTWSLLLQDVAEREMTVLVSSHNLRELEDVCDHVGIMFNGKLVLEKQLDDVKGEIHKLQIAFKEGVPQEFKDSINKKYLKNGSYSSVMIVVFVAIIIVINMIVGNLPSKYTQLDISSEKLYHRF